MDTIIGQILKIDAQAQQKIQEAYKQKDALKSQADAEAERAAKALREKCDARIRKIYDAEQSAAQASIEEIRSTTAAQQDQLKIRFAENEAGWITDILDAVLKS